MLLNNNLGFLPYRRTVFLYIGNRITSCLSTGQMRGRREAFRGTNFQPAKSAFFCGPCACLQGGCQVYSSLHFQLSSLSGATWCFTGIPYLAHSLWGKQYCWRVIQGLGGCCGSVNSVHLCLWLKE